MIPFHSVLPELAVREVRCLHLGDTPHSHSLPGLPPDKYAYVEFYCAEPDCDCRRVALQVVGRSQPAKALATISYGWENEAFYRKQMPSAPEDARGVIRGELEPMLEQSEFAEKFLELFQNVVLDEPYRLRLRRHYRLFKEELARRAERGTV